MMIVTAYGREFFNECCYYYYYYSDGNVGKMTPNDPKKKENSLAPLIDLINF